MVKEKDFGETKFSTIRFNLKIMDFAKRHTREKKDECGKIFISMITDLRQKWSVFSLNVKLFNGTDFRQKQL